jgi:peptidoglycan/xylan/chitin deacetylase (PgdA/CDA1 family)
MIIKIRRYHLILLICFILTCGLSVSTSSRETVRLLKEEIGMSSSLPSLDLRSLPEPVRTPLPLQDLSPLPRHFKTVAFTFDDGPHPVYTEKLLKILKKFKVHATFFVVGKQAERYPDLIRKIAEDGHELANHTYSHRNMTTLSEKEIEAELGLTNRIVESVTGTRMHVFRPPGGQVNRSVQKCAEALGYTMALWTVLPMDHLRPSASLIQERVMRGLNNHGIVLLHSGVGHTIDALPALIRSVQKEGYNFVTVSELVADRGRRDSLAHMPDHGADER